MPYDKSSDRVIICTTNYSLYDVSFYETKRPHFGVFAFPFQYSLLIDYRRSSNKKNVVLFYSFVLCAAEKHSYHIYDYIS